MKETHDEGLGWPRCVRACVREGQKLREIKLLLMMMRMVMENVVGFIEPHMNARGRITSCACKEGTPQIWTCGD